jgi:peptidoglycan hydrolase-like protein with peptidoglycan-binding domain
MKVRHQKVAPGRARSATKERPYGAHKRTMISAGAGAGIGLVMLAAACSGGASTSSPTTTANTPVKAAPNSNVKTMQEALSRVGCYSGVADGVAGPQTTQAVRNFQAASHLAVDGVYGPKTEGSLTAAARAGAQVCQAAASSSTTPAPRSGTTAPRPTTAPASTTTIPRTSSTTTPRTSSTTASPSAAAAPCTATAISAALEPGQKLLSYRCGSGWAGGSWENSAYAAAFLLQSHNGVWVRAGSDACANAATLRIPASVLDVSFCKVS